VDKSLLYDVDHVAEKDGMPFIKVQIKRADKYSAPEKISTKVLEKLKAMAEVHLNRTVKYAVLTVPSHFNDTQKHATKDAAMVTGLNVLLSSTSQRLPA
jgi:L1 cell adhesion molecule like protein